MFFRLVSDSYRIVLIISAIWLVVTTLAHSIGMLSSLSQMEMNMWPLAIVMNKIASFVWMIVFSLVLCSFLLKRASQLKSRPMVGKLAFFAKILSIIGLLLTIPWLYCLMNSSISWFGQLMSANLGVPFDFWFYVLATGIILHEVAAMTALSKGGESDIGDEDVNRSVYPEPEVKNILFP